MALKLNSVLTVLGIIIFLSSNKVFGDVRATEHAILRNILKGYDPNVLPVGKNGTGPVEVVINFYLRQMGEIDDEKQTFDVQLTFRQEWVDTRLKYDPTKDLEWVTVAREGVIWVPDLFFSNEDTGRYHDVLEPNVLIRVYPDGRVLYSKRISLSLFCKIDMHNYPLDNQVCNVVMASYAHTSNSISFDWKDTLGIQVTKNLNQRKFKLNAYSLTDCTSSTTTGTYSCLMAKFFLSRNFQTFLVHVYIPTASLVLLCWIVFWINPENSTIRFGIWIGTLITMFMLVISIGFKAPETPYTKAIDIWTGTCFTFLFAVGIELCLVKRAIENKESSLENKDEDNLEEAKNARNSEDHQIKRRLQDYAAFPLKWYNRSSKVQRMDGIFRVAYLLIFALFTFFYWVIHSEKQQLCEGGGHCFIVQ